ncbi:MAG: hypothetical protein P8X89_23210, partial [Reinekea sp.]
TFGEQAEVATGVHGGAFNQQVFSGAELHIAACVNGTAGMFCGGFVVLIVAGVGGFADGIQGEVATCAEDHALARGQGAATGQLRTRYLSSRLSIMNIL